MNLVLAPLRFLLASEADPSLFDLEGNHENRIDTLLYHVAQVLSFLSLMSVSLNIVISFLHLISGERC